MGKVSHGMEPQTKSTPEELPPAPSMNRSHYPFTPVSGLELFQQDVSRRNALRRRGNCLTGCREIDDHVLAGGFERGTVVGVSAEQEDMGLLLGLQTIARLLVVDAAAPAAPASQPKPCPKVLIVTTLAPGTLLPTLCKVLDAQAELLPPSRYKSGSGNAARGCLDRISISRVFDMDGLWDMFRELGAAVESESNTGNTSSTPQSERSAAAAVALTERRSTTSGRPQVLSATVREDCAESSVGEVQDRGYEKMILDSEYEDDGMTTSSDSSALSSPPRSPTRSCPSPSAPAAAPTRPLGEEAKEEARAAKEPQRPTSPTPEIILVTHVAALLTALFRVKDKHSAHAVLAQFASHLRHVTRSPDHGCPLVILLNTTTSTTAAAASATGTPRGRTRMVPKAAEGRGHPEPGASSRPPDPTLRSIFSLAPLGRLGHASGGGNPVVETVASARRSKPCYGLLFSQLLDLHLLVTLIPRTRRDAEALRAGPTSPPRRLEEEVRFVAVVEVLLDELGVWRGHEEESPLDARRTAARVNNAPVGLCREQRWGVVEAPGGVKIVDAFRTS